MVPSGVVVAATSDSGSRATRAKSVSSPSSPFSFSEWFPFPFPRDASARRSARDAALSRRGAFFFLVKPLLCQSSRRPRGCPRTRRGTHKPRLPGRGPGRTRRGRREPPRASRAAPPPRRRPRGRGASGRRVLCGNPSSSGLGGEASAVAREPHREPPRRSLGFAKTRSAGALTRGTEPGEPRPPPVRAQPARRRRRRRRGRGAKPRPAGRWDPSTRLFLFLSTRRLRFRRRRTSQEPSRPRVCPPRLGAEDGISAQRPARRRRLRPKSSSPPPLSRARRAAPS